MFGDQTLFCRSSDFHAVSGYDESLALMEDLDLVMRLHSQGPCSLPLTKAKTHPFKRTGSPAMSSFGAHQRSSLDSGAQAAGKQLKAQLPSQKRFGIGNLETLQLSDKASLTTHF